MQQRRRQPRRQPQQQQTAADFGPLQLAVPCRQQHVWQPWRRSHWPAAHVERASARLGRQGIFLAVRFTVGPLHLRSADGPNRRVLGWVAPAAGPAAACMYVCSKVVPTPQGSQHACTLQARSQGCRCLPACQPTCPPLWLWLQGRALRGGSVRLPPCRTRSSARPSQRKWRLAASGAPCQWASTTPVASTP